MATWENVGRIQGEKGDKGEDGVTPNRYIIDSYSDVTSDVDVTVNEYSDGSVEIYGMAIFRDVNVDNQLGDYFTSNSISIVLPVNIKPVPRYCSHNLLSRMVYFKIWSASDGSFSITSNTSQTLPLLTINFMIVGELDV